MLCSLNTWMLKQSHQLDCPSGVHLSSFCADQCSNLLTKISFRCEVQTLDLQIERTYQCGSYDDLYYLFRIFVLLYIFNSNILTSLTKHKYFDYLEIKLWCYFKAWIGIWANVVELPFHCKPIYCFISMCLQICGWVSTRAWP